ncbi:hypothetical protein M8818_006654 [Zalaria obscura]|uniref:Uncharacterized protein n=1 Tax=Zalaria obscura TaxID=2024903 RepID=A0ACC3S6D3_9PEZI
MYDRVDGGTKGYQIENKRTDAWKAEITECQTFTRYHWCARSEASRRFAAPEANMFCVDRWLSVRRNPVAWAPDEPRLLIGVVNTEICNDASNTRSGEVICESDRASVSG